MEMVKKALVLEQKLEFAPRLEQTTIYKTIDVYAIGTTALYTPPIKIYDFSGSGVQLHIHGSLDGNTLYGGGFKKYGEDKIFHPLNGFEVAMADYNFQIAGIKPIEPFKSLEIKPIEPFKPW